MNTRTRRIVAALATPIVAALVLTGCGNDDYQARVEQQQSTTLKDSLGIQAQEERLKREEDTKAVRYVYVLPLGSTQAIGYYVIHGGVYDASTQLAPEQELVQPCGGCDRWVMDSARDNGTYGGEGGDGFFFFTTDGIASNESPHPTASKSATPNPTTKTSAANSQNAPSAQVASPPPTNSYAINEQFNGTNLDTNLWQVMSYPKGYRNNEEEEYTPSQVRVNNGTLQLTAERLSNNHWKSGEVHSKWNYMYGEFEVRMKISSIGPGVWPAAWLMGTTDQWPGGGEIDIIESVNGLPTVYSTLHGGGRNGHWQLQAHMSSINITQYHTYKIVKTPGVISWWVDGTKQKTWTQNDTPNGGVWPFENHRYFGLLNFAVGGTWPGPSSSSTPSPVTMYVDYFTVKNAS